MARPDVGDSGHRTAQARAYFDQGFRAAMIRASR